MQVLQLGGFHIFNIDTLWMICFADFNFVIKYGIIWGGYSANTDQVFILQKRVVKMKATIECRLFKKSDIVPIPCQYIFSLMMLAVKLEDFWMNFSVHSADTRNKAQPLRPVANLSCFQKVFFVLV